MEIELSKRELKNRETKKKLTDAMNYIMNEYDYNTVTIRNICKVSGVAYGSFYNLFESKEDFLRYYLTSDFVDYKNNYYKENKYFDTLNPLEKSIDIFVCCGHYNIEKGVKFISGFYTPNNTSLSPLKNNGKEYSFTPLVNEAKEYLKEAQKQKLIDDSINIEETVIKYCLLFNGITFNWCISNGEYDIIEEINKQLNSLIKM